MIPQSLTSAVQTSRVFPFAESLDLSYCNINDETIWDICMWLSRGACPWLKDLNLFHNEIGKPGWRKLSSFLRDDSAFQKIVSLNLAFNQAHGCAAIVHAVERVGKPSQRNLYKMFGFCNDAQPLQICKPHALPILERLTFTLDVKFTLQLEHQLRLGALPSLIDVQTPHGYTLDIGGYLFKASNKLQQTIMARRRKCYILSNIQ